MKSKLLIGAIALVFVGVLGVAFLQQPSASFTAPVAIDQGSTGAQAQPAPATTGASSGSTQTSGSSSTGGSTQSSGSGASSAAGYTMAEVATHDSQRSCWTAINGNVYDVTQWISQHPGGADAILSLCGIDGSAAFNGQHGGQRRPASELAQFLLGPLKS